MPPGVLLFTQTFCNLFSHMLDETRKSIGILIARVLGSRRHAAQMSFRGVYTKARTALFIMPPEEEHRTLALSVIQKAQHQFRGNAMTILTPDTVSRAIAGKLQQCMVVPIHQEQINFFYLPKKNLITRLKEKRYDVIVDLNLNVTPLAASVCAHVDAPLKAGFSSPQGEALYNLQLQTPPTRHPKLRYEQLMTTLAMF